MARRKATQETQPEPTQPKTRWLSLDLRSKAEKTQALEYLDPEQILVALVNIAAEGGNFYVKPNEDGTVKVMTFLPTDDPSEQLGISSFGKTPFEALGALAYKYMVLLPQVYDLDGTEDDDLPFG